MKAFDPYGITSNGRKAPYRPESLRQFPAIHGGSLSSTELRKFPEIYGGRDESPRTEGVRKFPEIYGG